MTLTDLQKEQRASYNIIYRAQYNKEKKEKIVADGRKYYIENKENILATNKLYHKENKEVLHGKHQEHYQKNREKYIAQGKKRYETKRSEVEVYREENKEAIAKTLKEYRTAHVSKIKEWSKLYNKRPESIFKIYQRSAKDRGYSFTLTFEEFMTFWQKPCYYSGHSIETIGLDRVDNAKGYDFNNVVSCCRVCNMMKMSMTVEEFVAHVDAIKIKLLGV